MSYMNGYTSYFYPQQQQQQVPQMGGNAAYVLSQTSTSLLKGRPVSSLEEARGAQVDFDGSLFIFPDIANKKIYTKQINLDGTASLRIYNLDESDPNPLPQAYVTQEEFNAVVENLKSLIVQQQGQTQPKAATAQSEGINFF